MSVYDLSVTDALLSTTRAVRKRLDLERDVPEALLRECLELSQQAPTGSNKQGWRWLIVTDAAKRQALADIYRKGAGAYLAGAQESAPAGGQDEKVFSSAIYLAERLQDVPVHVIPCIAVDHLPENPPRAAWASRLIPRAKPRFSRWTSTSSWGNAARMASTEPSSEALSRTKISYSRVLVSRTMERRHARVFALVL
jgi:nitroreductase